MSKETPKSPTVSCRIWHGNARKRTGLRPKKKGKRDEKHRKCRIRPTPVLNPTPYPSPEIPNVQREFQGWV